MTDPTPNDDISHLDEPHPLADLMAVVERVAECTCYDRTCDHCRRQQNDSTVTDV